MIDLNFTDCMHDAPTESDPIDQMVERHAKRNEAVHNGAGLEIMPLAPSLLPPVRGRRSRNCHVFGPQV